MSKDGVPPESSGGWGLAILLFSLFTFSILFLLLASPSSFHP